MARINRIVIAIEYNFGWISLAKALQEYKNKLSFSEFNKLIGLLIESEMLINQGNLPMDEPQPSYEEIPAEAFIRSKEKYFELISRMSF